MELKKFAANSDSIKHYLDASSIVSQVYKVVPSRQAILVECKASNVPNI